MFKIIKMSDNTKSYVETFYIIFDEMRKAMENVVPGDSISQNFIDRMIPHHEAAIKMSENILKYTTNAEIEEIAKSIIAMQSRDIESMKAMRDECDDKSDTRDLFLYEKGYMSAYDKMVQGMSASQTGNNVDIDFLTEMIPHHEGAISMAQNLLRFEICPPLRTLAEGIVKTQSEQAQQMKDLLKRLVSAQNYR